MTEPALQVEQLSVQFRTDEGLVRAVEQVSFELRRGETLGLVGESGSGKSVTSLAVMGLVPCPPGRIAGGRVLYEGRDLLRLDERQWRALRGRRIAMIFQDPMTALNPFLTVAEQLMEVTELHLGHSSRQARRHAIEMLEQVGIPAAADRIDSYPHEFSGGMRQRVMIAMALSCQPDILLADEPTTALDVTIQAQILDLMQDLQRAQGTSIVLITHDLGVVASVCHRVQVMYAGRIVERADVEPLFADPRHPYTRGLLRSVPRWDQPSETLQAITGQPPNLAHLPSGCPFHPRCPYRQPACLETVPPLAEARHGGRAACLVDLDAALPDTEARP